MRRRSWPVVLGVVLVGSLLGRSAVAAVVVSVSYYDTEHASPSKPDPWSGSPKTTFFGSPDANGVWDTGGILFSNRGLSDAVIKAGLKVDGFANGASFESWDGDIGPGGFTLHGGQNVIFAGHGSGTFDTSDQPIITDPNLRTNNRPQVHVMIDGIQYQFSDAAQVLNTGGFDPGEAFHTSESLPWSQVGATPEPSGVLFCGGIISMVAMGRRRLVR